MSKFNVTYEVDHGYVGKNRPQHFTITEGEIDTDMSEAELEMLFQDSMEDDFQQTISCYSNDLEDFLTWARKRQEEMWRKENE